VTIGVCDMYIEYDPHYKTHLESARVPYVMQNAFDIPPKFKITGQKYLCLLYLYNLI